MLYSIWMGYTGCSSNMEGPWELFTQRWIREDDISSRIRKAKGITLGFWRYMKCLDQANLPYTIVSKPNFGEWTEQRGYNFFIVADGKAMIYLRLRYPNIDFKEYGHEI